MAFHGSFIRHGRGVDGITGAGAAETLGLASELYVSGLVAQRVITQSIEGARRELGRAD